MDITEEASGVTTTHEVYCITKDDLHRVTTYLNFCTAK